MTFAISIAFLFFIYIYLIKPSFDKKYKNTEVSQFFRHAFICALWLIPVVWCAYLYDLSHTQHTGNSTQFGVIFGIFSSPFVVIFFFLFSHLVYIFLFIIIDSILFKNNRVEKNYLKSIYILTFIMICLLELMWWCFFYTKISTILRVFAWNAIILIFPVIPIFYALFRTNNKNS